MEKAVKSRPKWLLALLAALCGLAVAVAFYKNRVRQLRRQEEEKLMQTIEEALRESEDPVALQKRIQGIIDNRNRMTASVNKTVRGLDKYIVGEEGETFHGICQRFAVKEKAIRKLNGLPANYQPKEGDELVLRPESKIKKLWKKR